MDSNMKLYALSPLHIELYLSDVENILEGPETARWPALFSTWRALRPKPHLPAKVYSTHDRPLTDVRDFEWWRATLFREGSKVPRRISFLDSSEWYVYLPVDVVLAA